MSFLDCIRADLHAVEARMNADLGSDVRSILALTHNVLNAGGKRLRPALVALTARAVDPNADGARIATVGSSIEFVHMATLVHDDVVDATAIRRGKPTANAVFGNGIAVLSGDYILARAMRLLAIDGDLRIIRVVSDVTVAMSEGEVMEIGATGRSDLSLDEYIEIVRKKTAVFVEGCCRCGSLLSDAPAGAEKALASYGRQLGMAFQIADDLLDYIGDPAVTGKPRGTDMRDGRATLPFIMGLREASATERARLLTAFGKPELADADMDAACAILNRLGAFDKARATAIDHIDRAGAALTLLPDSPARQALSALTSYVIDRDC
jgi:octaprenyl-diphosphate synthase